MITSIGARDLASLLESGPDDDLGMRARELVYELDPDATLAVGTQTAAPTAETLHLKYSLASERGVTVLGLESLAGALRGMGTERVSGCSVEGAHQFILVFFTEDGTELIGILCITPSNSSVCGSVDFTSQ